MEKLKNSGTIDNHKDSYERAFDSIADDYDATFDSNPVTKQLRQIIYDSVLPILNENSNVLDISCGAGTDALTLASDGHNVTCFDISPRMISYARRKLKDFPYADLRIGSFENLHTLPVGSFNLILSNFGGLNCTPDLRPVFKRCYELLKPAGHLVIIVMPPVSIWEVISGLTRLNFKLAFRRMRKNPVVRMNNSSVPVYYHSLRSVRSVSRKLFNVGIVRGLNVLSPPPYSRKFVSKHPHVSAVLSKLDSIFGFTPITRAMGDHMLVVMQKDKTGKDLNY